MFYTKWPFKCAGCGETFPADTRAHYEDGVLVADDCPGPIEHPQNAVSGPEASNRHGDPMPRNKTLKDRCDVCFQVPSSNGACGCF